MSVWLRAPQKRDSFKGIYRVLRGSFKRDLRVQGLGLPSPKMVLEANGLDF